MSKTKELITNALIHYDKNSERYQKLYNKFKHYSYEFKDSDIEHNVIIFYDDDKKEIFRSKYEIIGIYYNLYDLWTWSWSVPDLNKNSVFISRKILNYGLDIPPTKEDLFMKTELVTSRFRITNEVQLDIHIAIASYISKNPMLYKIVQNLDTPYSSSDGLNPVDTNVSKNSKIYYLFLLEHEKLKQ